MPCFHHRTIKFLIFGRGQTIQQKAEIDKEIKQRRVRIIIIKETQILKDLKRGKLKLDVLTSCLVFILMFERLCKSVLESVELCQYLVFFLFLWDVFWVFCICILYFLEPVAISNDELIESAGLS